MSLFELARSLPSLQRETSLEGDAHIQSPAVPIRYITIEFTLVQNEFLRSRSDSVSTSITWGDTPNRATVPEIVCTESDTPMQGYRAIKCTLPFGGCKAAAIARVRNRNAVATDEESVS